MLECGIIICMKITSEKELVEFGREMGKEILEKNKFPVIFELVGDVGAGKTTLTRGIAEGLGVKEPVTSPSFMISKRYLIPCSGEFRGGELVHYDFYRLEEVGLMKNELEETLGEENAVVVIEWGESVRGILPKETKTIKINYLEDGGREILE